MKGEIDLKRFVNKYEYIIIAPLLLTAFCIHLYATSGGLIWNSDSFHYWSASRSFQSDFVLKAYDGGVYTFWPPLFPIIMSFFSEKAYYIFHTICLLSSLLFIYWVVKLKSSRNLAIPTLAIFSVSVYPYLVSSFLWSETIFILLFYSGLYFYIKWRGEQSKIQFLFIATILLSLMCLQRNAGVFIILGLTIQSIGTFLKERKWHYLLKMIFIHLVIITPNVVWNINQKLRFPEEFYFYSSPPIIDFFSNLKTFASELIRIFIPYSDLIPPFLLITAGTVILSVPLLSNINNILSTIFLTYIVSFLLLPKFELSETGRFLAPVIPLLILQLTTISKRLYEKLISRKMKMVLSALIVILLIYNITRTTKNVAQWNYRSKHQQKSAKIFY
ncbi:ArnT family glycosyltransferase [Marivirga harenae]|uniref:ArnT family glycosyltransferase n=1 Tax=Marivirga harenae TaxID=2010992 RepID=UPI0026DED34C|nr:hypothetical protein [Marivirga harenae]WKV10471.1 hypothetical protein Q3Y49_09620 [Marivirga harenae]